MARKEKVIRKIDIEKDEKAIKRQRRNKIIGKVFACLFVLIFVGSIVGATAGAYTVASGIWWESVGEEAGVEFKELFTLFNGVSDTNEKKIVTKAYDDNDLNDFYSNLKKKIYLSDNYDLSISKIIGAVMSSTSDGEGSSAQTNTIGTDGYDLMYVYTDNAGRSFTSDVLIEDEPAQTEGNGEGNSSLTGNEDLDKLLQEIEFDFSSLEQYKGEENILEISDKQLAAAVNDALSALSESFEALAELEKTLGKPLNELIEIKQIIIEGNEISAQDTAFKITLAVKVKDLLSNILTQNNIPSIVNSILPKMLYATATVYPNNSTKAVQVSINRMGESKVDKIIRIVDVILKKTGNTTSLGNMLVDVNGKVVDVINKAQEKMPIMFVPTCSVNLRPIEALMGMMQVDVSEQAFLYMLKDIKLPTADTLGLKILTTEAKQQKTAVFVGELSAKYCLDNSDGKISCDNTIKDVMNFAGSDDALSAVHLDKMEFGSEYSKQGLKVRTSYDALAGMLSDYVVNEGMLGDIQADIVGMSYTSKNEILSVDIRVSLSKMLGFDDNSVMSSLIKQLVPENIFVTANICVNAQRNIPTTIEINKTGADKSKEHLQTLTALASKFGMDASTLSYESICEQIDGGLQQGLNQMQEQIGCEILFAEDCAYLPNVFEVVCGTKLLDESEEKHIEPETLYTIMKQAFTFEIQDSDRNKTLNANGFIGELESKYYLQQGRIVDNGDGALFDSVKQLQENFGSSIDKDALANDGRAMNSIYPLLTAGEFAYLLGQNIDLSGISGVLKSAEIVGAIIDESQMAMYLSANLYETGAQTREDAANADNTDLSKYSNLLPQKAFITVFIDVNQLKSTDGSTCVNVVIDGMEDEYMSDFFSIVRKLTGQNTDKGEIETKIDAQVKEYMNGIEAVDYKFVDGGLEIDNIFNVIAKSDMVKSDDPQEHVFEADEIRMLLKKLYGYDYDAEGKGGFSAANGLDRFINEELYNKYFISETFKENLKKYEKDDTLLDGFADIGGQKFSADNVRMNDLTSLSNVTLIGGKTQAQLESEITQKFKPKFSREELAYLLSSHVSVVSDISFLTEQQVVFVGNDEYTMTLTLKGKGNLEDENAKGLVPEFLYVNVTIELGDVVDGVRTSMNVYSMDINSVEYVEDGGEDQDLQLLIMFIERIKGNTQDTSGQEPPQEQEVMSFDGMLNKLETNLNEFKDKIHNDVFTVSFLADGGFVFNETIYQVALNSVYGIGANASQAQKKDMPDEINFRNGICKVNNMPDKYEYSDNVFIDFKQGNRAVNSSSSIAQINDKYALERELQDGVAILSVLGDYAKNYAESISGQKLTSQQKRAMSIEQLRPSIIGEELLLMLENSVIIQAEGYQNAVMKAMYILDDEMIIVYQSSVNIGEENSKYADLLPQIVSLVVDIDINKMYDENAVCTQIGINDLLREETDAIEALMQKLNQEDGSGQQQSLAEANEQCSGSVRSTMSDLTNNMHVDFVAGKTVDGVTDSGMMILASIYEVAANKINSVKQNGEDDITPQEIKGMLEALFDGLDIPQYTAPSGIDANIYYAVAPDYSSKASRQLFLSVNASERNVNIDGAIGGWNIGSMIKTEDLLTPLGIAQNAEGKDDALLIQHSEFVPAIADAGSDENFALMRQKLKSLGDGASFLLTLNVDMEVAAGVAMSILPQRMYLSVIMDMETQGASIVYNSMNDDQRKVLARLIKTNRDSSASGLDMGNTEAVKNQILDMNIIEHDLGGGNKFCVTLGDILSSKGKRVVTASQAQSLKSKNEGVVLGRGAIVVDYAKSI